MAGHAPRIAAAVLMTACLVPVVPVGVTAARAAEAEVYISIGKQSPSATTLLLAPFLTESEWKSSALCTELTSILRDDLRVSGYFYLPDSGGAEEDLAARERDGPIDLARWRDLGGTILVKGTCRVDEKGVSLSVRVYDLTTGLSIFAKRFQGPTAGRRRLVHQAADEIVYNLTGLKGIATTRIAFVSDSSGVKEIMTMDYDGHNATPVTSMKALSLFPAWSPDGAVIAFTSYRDANPDLFVVRPDGRDLRRLVDYPGLNTHPSWSPDGRTLALTLSRDGNPEIYLFDVRKRELTRLTVNAASDTSPDWSPDGKRLVFTSDRSGTPQLYVMDTSGSNVSRLTFQGEFNDTAAWSPRGDLIAYASMRGGLFRIHFIAPDGSGDREVLAGPRNYEDPSWAPDGRHLAFTLNTTVKQQIYRLDIDTGEVAAVTSSGRSNSSPDWSPFTGGW